MLNGSTFIVKLGLAEYGSNVVGELNDLLVGYLGSEEGGAFEEDG